MSLIVRSLQLDLQMLSLPMSWRHKFEFILKKYWILVKNHLIGYSATKSFVVLFGEKYHYDDRFGIAFLQSVFVDHFDLSRHIQPGGVVIDIGANIGQFNFFSRHCLRAAAVYSFEPVQETFNVLKLNARSNIYNIGIASSNKEYTFYTSNTSLMASSCKTDDYSGEVTVACTRLDGMEEINALPSIHLVKIDTEGSELDVVRGSLATLKRAEYVLIEASIVRESDGDLVALTGYMRECLPELRLVWIGRHFEGDGGQTLAIDCLFRNIGHSNG